MKKCITVITLSMLLLVVTPVAHGSSNIGILPIKPTSKLTLHKGYSFVFTEQSRNQSEKTANIAQEDAYKSFLSEYDMIWDMMSDDYENFYLVGHANDSEVGGYETRAGKSAFGIAIGASRATVQKKYGEPIKHITKDKKNYVPRLLII